MKFFQGRDGLNNSKVWGILDLGAFREVKKNSIENALPSFSKRTIFELLTTFFVETRFGCTKEKIKIEFDSLFQSYSFNHQTSQLDFFLTFQF